MQTRTPIVTMVKASKFQPEELEQLIQKEQGRLIAVYEFAEPLTDKGSTGDAIEDRFDYVVLTEFPSREQATKLFQQVETKWGWTHQTLVATPIKDYAGTTGPR